MEGWEVPILVSCTKAINNFKLRKIAQGKLWNITKKKQKSLRSSKSEDGSIEKHRKHFICVTSSLSPKPLGAKGNSLRGILPHREKENRRTSSRLTTYKDICSLCY